MLQAKQWQKRWQPNALMDTMITPKSIMPIFISIGRQDGGRWRTRLNFRPAIQFRSPAQWAMAAKTTTSSIRNQISPLVSCVRASECAQTRERALNIIQSRVYIILFPAELGLQWRSSSFMVRTARQRGAFAARVSSLALDKRDIREV